MSGQSPECDHRVYKSLIVILGALTLGLAGGVAVALTGTRPFDAVKLGASVTAFTFTAGLAVAAYVGKHQS
ncbi:hypothetical protein GCM10010387_07090 [Streptomyces inusitatus]|uniref:Uncharacterized protein n=1 Tax=Streptomyces inusitatus TaxID=68221 RepID=A0A918PNN9_9ACTN|nr:hypothetical protein GCM10010387_07090 [Streptomyces inusitatus]